MNIGFDAKRAFTNGTGLGHYSRTLISSLAKYFAMHQYFLFTPKQTSLYSTENVENLQVVTPQNFLSKLFKSAWRSSWVKKDVQKLHIDIYHGLSHEIPMGIHSTNIKSVVTIHDLIFERYPEQYNSIDVKIYRKKFTYACKHANKIIAISKQTKEDIIAFYKIPENKIAICYQSCNPAFGVAVTDAEKNRIKKQYNLPNKFFLYVGSVIERKNLLTICKALHLLHDTSSSQSLKFPLVVIGTGDKYMQQVKDFITQNSLTNAVIFLSENSSAKALSFTSAADFPAIYQQALCMIYPSTFEGFGIPVLEALWSNIPVITSNVSCMPETGGNAAYYVNPMDVNEMATAMYKVATNDILRKEMIAKGWLHAQNFTQKKCAEAVIKVYEEVYRS